MKKILLIALAISLTACGASYSYSHVSADGESCSLTILSAREVQAGDVRITKNCSLTGGADSLTTNDKTLEAMSVLINKIP